MGTAVLRSHDPLRSPHHLDAFGSRSPPTPARPSRRKQPRSASPCAAPPGRGHPQKPAVRSTPPRPGRRVSFADKAVATAAVVVKFPSPNLVMGEVKILKRGDDPRLLDAGGAAAAPDVEVSPLFSTDRLGPEPEILPKQIGFSDVRPVYAGPAFITSPSPSSLPFPACLLKKEGAAGNDDVATKNLCHLLRLGVLAP